MSTDPLELEKFVYSPSASAVAYQACSLVEALEEITHEEYPPEACQIRDVLLSIACYVRDQLWIMNKSEEPDSIPKESKIQRVLSLGDIVQELYSYLRYLRASIPIQTPPSIQLALSQLTNLYYPSRKDNKPICLVRPQWKYNLTCVTITWDLKKILSKIDVLDPEEELGKGLTPLQFGTVLWKNYRNELPAEKQNKLPKKPPRQLATLSFAGLDTHDTLLYPLLAHELGHFIDFSDDPPYNIRDPIKKISAIKYSDVRNILKNYFDKADLDKNAHKYLYELNERTAVCIKEILADLLATRMLGLGFFAAHSEFLKTLTKEKWYPIIGKEGYPGLKFRLSIILNYLLSSRYVGNLSSFFSRYDNQESKDLLRYLEKWRDRVGNNTSSKITDPVEAKLKKSAEESKYRDSTATTETDQVEMELNNLAENAVQDTVKHLITAAEQLIPNKTCARLTESFFERIKYLRFELPPSIPNEHTQAYAEIMAASWAYQILYGERIENRKEKLEERLEEYRKTCRLVLKAIELIPPTTRSASDNIPSDVPRKGLNSSKKAAQPIDRKVLFQRGVLERHNIQHRISIPIEHPSHLGVVPYDPDSVKHASLEVHLGNWFSFARRMKLGSIQPWRENDKKLLRTVGREKVFVPSDGVEKLLLHPGDLVLGVTKEFFSLPGDIMAFVEGKSGLGRLGLIVATASQVAPGFHGVIVLELANTGTVPLELIPEKPIAQLVFQTVTKELKLGDLYRENYHCQITP